MTYYLNKGYIEWSLDVNAFNKEFITKCSTFNINPHDVKFYSQQDEDKYIIQYLLKEKINDGTYLEIGACDGLLYSNTKTLEEHFGFKGILIEPQPVFFSNIAKNRNLENNEIYNYAVSNSDTEYIDFIGDNAEGGISTDINTDLSKHKNWNSYKVKNIKMCDLLNKSNFKYLDFMIIDVEGSEFSLLKSIDFSFPIYCIIIEAHSGEKEKNKIFGDYLKLNGFTFKERQRGNEIWLNHTYFRKHLFNL
jgi:FkbM family methyltransferase